MSNESNRPLKLLRPLTEDLLRILRIVDRIAAELDIPFLLAGAAARDTVLVNLWGMHVGRATADVDFAFSVRDWTHFRQLRDALLATERFAIVTHQQQRLYYRDLEHSFSVPVDLVPFHGVARTDQKIEWPPEGDFVMNVAGFEEALASALSVEAESNLVVRITSIPGLLVLKLIAWLDRNAINNKDAADIFTLLNSYAFAGNEDRLYDQEHGILEAVDYDLVLAGAHLLGGDAARIVHGETAQQVRALLNSEQEMDRLLSQIIGSATPREDKQIVPQVDQFRLGFLKGMDRDAVRKKLNATRVPKS